jgi:hypothetical protein
MKSVSSQKFAEDRELIDCLPTGGQYMSELNVDIPRFYCLMRKEFFYDGTAHQGEYINVCVFAAASVSGRALGFHILTDEGAILWRAPIHALCHKKGESLPLDFLQFWDCFSYDITCNAFDRLKECRCRVHLKDGTWMGGQYMFTFDWYGSEDSEDAGEGGHKCAHVIALDNGNFCAQSNNRIQWFDPSFITPFKEKPDYLTNTRVWAVERETETANGYFFDAQPEREAQVALYCKGMRSDVTK